LVSVPEIVSRIAEATGGCFAPASERQVSELAALGLPEVVLGFFRSYAPQCLVNGKIRLLSIRDIAGANSNIYPGAAISAHGYVVFAETYGGDAYAFDLNKTSADGQPRIVLVSHEFYSENCLESDIERIAKPVAKDLLEFLCQLADEKVDDYPNPVC